MRPPPEDQQVLLPPYVPPHIFVLLPPYVPPRSADVSVFDEGAVGLEHAASVVAASVAMTSRTRRGSGRVMDPSR